MGKKKEIIYKNKTYKGIKELCDDLGIDENRRELIYSRTAIGWSLEDAIEKEKKQEILKRKWEKEEKLKEELKESGVSLEGYKTRIKKGMSEEEAKTKKRYGYYDSIIKDHLGNEFKTAKEMKKYWGISDTTFKRRRAKGWTLKEILETRPEDRYNITDCYGNTFSCHQEMADYYGVTRVFLRNRMSRYGKDDPRTYAPRIERGEATQIKCKDHLGNEFDSMTKMCRHYGIELGKYRDRIKLGWTLEDALTEPDQKDKSAGEKAVEKILKKKKIKYEYDKRLADIIGCPRNKNRQRVDFYLNDYNVVIEFDGRQHFEGFGTTKCTKEMLQDRDKKKEKILLKNKIPVLRIKHNQFDKIQELIEDLISEPEKYLKIRNKYLTNKEYWKK